MRISFGELAELQALAEFIPSNDVELREAAGLPEYAEAPDFEAEKADHKEDCRRSGDDWI